LAAKPKSDEIRRVFAACRGYFLTAALFSLAINLLYLAGPLYMLQVYDRVIASGSVTTLVMLTIALVVAFAALAGLDVVRARVLARAGVRLDRLLSGRVVSATVEHFGGSTSGGQLLRDFDTVRQFISGSGVVALFDLPWVPLYIGVIFLLHPWLGLFALCSAIVLVVAAVVNEWLVRQPQSEANAASARNYAFTEMSLRNSEVIRAMGMIGGVLQRWGRQRNRLLERQLAAGDRASTMTSLIKLMRMSMQSLILGLGAFLVIQRLATAGAMFAASILLGRALQPVEQTVGQWRGLVSAHGAWQRVRDLLLASPPPERSTELPRPDGRLAVEGLLHIPPGATKPILRNVSFNLEPGESLGIIGPSGAGKSTLARHMVGVLRPTAGSVRLDGADIRSWLAGSHIGYLPQDIELFADTVAANIGRFATDADDRIVEAAKLAGVHEMILRLPDGYDTEVGEGGAVLSGGFRQRVGLARAIFGNPSLVLLDEPSSNLDNDGDLALSACVAQLKQRGTTVVIVSHRAASLSTVDKILILRDGAVEVFSERAEFMRQLNRPTATALPNTEGAADTAAAG
jgi:PrtD family type I secretion system ABC transporter